MHSRFIFRFCAQRSFASPKGAGEQPARRLSLSCAWPVKGVSLTLRALFRILVSVGAMKLDRTAAKLFATGVASEVEVQLNAATTWIHSWGGAIASQWRRIWQTVLIQPQSANRSRYGRGSSRYTACTSAGTKVRGARETAAVESAPGPALRPRQMDRSIKTNAKQQDAAGSATLWRS